MRHAEVRCKSAHAATLHIVCLMGGGGAADAIYSFIVHVLPLILEISMCHGIPETSDLRIDQYNAYRYVDRTS